MLTPVGIQELRDAVADSLRHTAPLELVVEEILDEITQRRRHAHTSTITMVVNGVESPCNGPMVVFGHAVDESDLIRIDASDSILLSIAVANDEFPISP